ncbi:transcriptional repressor [Bacillus sp. J33]|uniref:transcriptional repressor n=1 Tax=Bacillus sp. J33 TaxID=935836 RepID=UPI00047C2B68
MDSLQIVFEILNSNGIQLNEKRKHLIILMAEQNKFNTAQQLKRLMQTIYPDISLDMIYRFLNILESYKIVYSRYLNGEKQFFMVNQLKKGFETAIFICTTCSQVHTVPYFLPKILFSDNTTIHHSCFEIYGTCCLCSSEISRD